MSAPTTPAPTRPAQPQPVRMSAAMEEALGARAAQSATSIDKSVHARLLSQRLAPKAGEEASLGAAVGSAELLAAARSACARWPFFANVVPENAVGQAVLDALGAVVLPPAAARYLAQARDTRPQLFEHGVVMALLSARLARDTGAPKVIHVEAAAAGLFHDLGMLHIETGRIDSGERLSGDELKPLYVHPITSSLLVEKFGVYSKNVVRAIVEHHERMDGSGYPRGLAGDTISPLGRVLALAEVVTAMFDGHRRFPEQRVSLLLRVNPKRYDAPLVATVQRLLAATPPESADGIDAPALVERLQRLGGALDLWRHSVKSISRELGGKLRELIGAIDEQSETLHRLLEEAGVSPAQLNVMVGGIGDDIARRVELWALAEELDWQLHAAVNQLKRGWQVAEPSRPHSAALAAWFDAVSALDADRR